MMITMTAKSIACLSSEAAPVRRLLMPVDVASYFRSLLFDIFDVLTISVTADADP